MFCWCTRRVISRMRTGASRLDRSFLCTHKKLISTRCWWLRDRARTLAPSTQRTREQSRGTRWHCPARNALFVNLNVGWDGADERHQLARRRHAHSRVPRLEPARRLERPMRRAYAALMPNGGVSQTLISVPQDAWQRARTIVRSRPSSQSGTWHPHPPRSCATGARTALSAGAPQQMSAPCAGSGSATAWPGAGSWGWQAPCLGIVIDVDFGPFKAGRQLVRRLPNLRGRPVRLNGPLGLVRVVCHIGRGAHSRSCR